MGSGETARRNRAAAVPVTKGICAFCGSSDQDETTVGQLYSLQDTVVHYYCALVSCGLVQKGRDEEGLFGFLIADVQQELLRGKKLKCSYCGSMGATVGCCVSACKKQFHLPCGKKRGAVSLFYGNYQSYCIQHAPHQTVPESIKVKSLVRKKNALGNKKTTNGHDAEENDETACAVCYLDVDAWVCRESFWPVCCARDRWLHTSCLQRMALSAGMHYLKCPLCNDKDAFQKAVQQHGVYIPDRDALWELEDRAYAELYERPKTCSAETCLCARGRDYDADEGEWELRLCATCGSDGRHAGCATRLYVCTCCRAVTPPDLEALVRIPLVTNAEPPEYRPLMTSRMSVRRTKPNASVPNRCGASKQDRMVKITKEIDDRDSDVDVESVISPSPVAPSFPPNTSNVAAFHRDSNKECINNTESSRLSLGITGSTTLLRSLLSSKSADGKNSIRNYFNSSKSSKDLKTALNVSDVGIVVSEKGMEKAVIVTNESNSNGVTEGNYIDEGVPENVEDFSNNGVDEAEENVHLSRTSIEVVELDETAPLSKKDEKKASSFKKKIQRSGPKCFKEKNLRNAMEDALVTTLNRESVSPPKDAETLNKHSTPTKLTEHNDDDIANISPVSEYVNVGKSSSVSFVDILSVSTDAVNENGHVSEENCEKLGDNVKEDSGKTSGKTGKTCEVSCLNDVEQVEIVNNEYSNATMAISENPKIKKKKHKLREELQCKPKKIVIKVKTPKIVLKEHKKLKVIPSIKDFEYLKYQYLSEIGLPVSNSNVSCNKNAVNDVSRSVSHVLNNAIEASLKKRRKSRNKRAVILKPVTCSSTKSSDKYLRKYYNKKKSKITEAAENSEKSDLASKSTFQPQCENSVIKLQKVLNRVNESFDKTNHQKPDKFTSPRKTNSSTMDKPECAVSDKKKSTVEKENTYTPNEITEQVTAQSHDNTESISNEITRPPKTISPVNCLITVDEEKLYTSLKYNVPVEHRNGILSVMKSTFDIGDVNFFEETQVKTSKPEKPQRLKRKDPEKYFLIKDMKSKFSSIQFPDANKESENTGLLIDLETGKLNSLGLSLIEKYRNKSSDEATPKRKYTKRKTGAKLSNQSDINLTDDQKCKKRKRRDSEEMEILERQLKSKKIKIDMETKSKRKRKQIDYSEEVLEEIDDSEGEESSKVDKNVKQSLIEDPGEEISNKVDKNLEPPAIDVCGEEKSNKADKKKKQSVLNFSPETPVLKSSGLSLKKRKKKESPDGLKQTTLNKFFNVQLTLT